MGDPIRRAALRQDRTGALPACDRTRHVAARGRDRRHHVEQRRADVRERHPRLRRFGKDAFAGRADLRDALRRGEHLRNAGAGGADYAPDGGARRQDPSQRETFRTDQSRLRPSRRAGTRRRAEPSAGEDLPQFRARRSAARRRAEGASEGDQRGAVAHGREVRAEPTTMRWNSPRPIWTAFRPRPAIWPAKRPRRWAGRANTSLRCTSPA